MQEVLLQRHTFISQITVEIILWCLKISQTVSLQSIDESYTLIQIRITFKTFLHPKEPRLSKIKTIFKEWKPGWQRNTWSVCLWELTPLFPLAFISVVDKGPSHSKYTVVPTLLLGVLREGFRQCLMCSRLALNWVHSWWWAWTADVLFLCPKYWDYSHVPPFYQTKVVMGNHVY